MPWEGMRELLRIGLGEAGDSVLVNGARGTRDIEGKVTRVGASDCGQRTSFKTELFQLSVSAFQLLNRSTILLLVT